MIASINDDDTTPLAAAAILHHINFPYTASSLLLGDSTHNKTHSFKMLATQSIAARKLLQPLEANEPDINLDRVDAINVLELLGNIYDNTIEIINFNGTAAATE
ncbi:p12 [Cyclophragma undans nucleopolyhedrovirus]|uniref:P12 n=1 Tax=Cyclophragma undans nucleopolyhedrovirus TaxID=1906244 RepID=A0A288Q809_9ABAC|nr:p12 [Cyclophragma undans nucleopolyhedrovirus]AOT85526.1 p12 [Cyclophragma undans nucleopolyhedrovirus]